MVNGAMVAEQEIEVKLAPGDNYRVIAAPRYEDLYFIEPVSKADDPNTPGDQSETQGRLFRDSNPYDVYNGEPIFDETAPLRVRTISVHASPMLTVWRRLHVEVDSMGAPNQNVDYGFDPAEPIDDHHPGGSLESPKTDLFADAFKPAFIAIGNVPAAWNQNNLQFRRDFANDSDRQSYFITGANAARQSSTEDSFY